MDCMGSQRVGHDGATFTHSLCPYILPCGYVASFVSMQLHKPDSLILEMPTIRDTRLHRLKAGDREQSAEGC